VFDAEQERIFGRHWICVGRDATLAAPATTSRPGCRRKHHRSARSVRGAARLLQRLPPSRTRLCEAPKGRLSETIQCPYHAWTYALDGRLIVRRHMHEVEGFDKKSYPLHTVALAEWNGFLFMNRRECRHSL